MTRNRKQLIRSLASNLPAVRSRISIVGPAVLWLGIAWAFVLYLGRLVGPMREGALQALLISPQFLLETSLGLLVIVAFCLLAFREAIPGIDNWRVEWLCFTLVVLWIGGQAVGLVMPGLEPSMQGKRPHCVIEAFAYSIPPLILAYSMMYRRFPLRSVRSGVYIGISAGAIPALFMQFACMYAPSHNLTHHMGPILVPVVVGGFMGYLFRRV